MISKCTDGKHGNYDLIIIILWNNHYDLNFNVGLRRQQEMKIGNMTNNFIIHRLIFSTRASYNNSGHDC